MSYIYKVTSQTEGGDESVHFDTETGSSDSFSDAHKCYGDLCFKLLNVEGKTMIKLYENGKIKKEIDRDGWIAMRSGGKKKGKSKAKGSPDKKPSAKKPKVSLEPKKQENEPVTIIEEQEEGNETTPPKLDKFAYDKEKSNNKKAKIDSSNETEKNEKTEVKSSSMIQEEKQVKHINKINVVDALEPQLNFQETKINKEKVEKENVVEESKKMEEEILTEEEDMIEEEEEDTQKYSFKEDSQSLEEEEPPQVEEVVEDESPSPPMKVISPFFAESSSSQLPKSEESEDKMVDDDGDDEVEKEQTEVIEDKKEEISEPESKVEVKSPAMPLVDPNIKYRDLSLPVRLKFKSGQGLELIIMRGDITTWKHSSVDESCTVVNAANERMLGGGGVDGAIHKAAGRELREHCKKIPEVSPGVRCETGEAVITPSFDMDHVDSIIHTPGPVYDEDQADLCRILLSNCYQSCLTLGDEHGHSHIGFPALSCGVFGYPLQDAGEAALESIEEFNEKEIVQKKNSKDDKGKNKLKTVTFVMFEKTTVIAWLDVAQSMGMTLVDHPSLSDKTSSSNVSLEPVTKNAGSSSSSSSSSSTSSSSNGSVGPKGKFLWQVAAQKAKESLINSKSDMATIVDTAQSSKS